MLALKLIPHSVTAIDPGISGAVARVERGTLAVSRNFKTPRDITRAIQLLAKDTDLLVIENVHAMPGEGVCSVFSFGKYTGIAFGTAFSVHVPEPVEVVPQVWQAYFRELYDVPKVATFKDFTCEIAAKVFPEHAGLFFRKSTRSKKGVVREHGSADAALMAAYGLLRFELLCARRGTPDDSAAGKGK